ncbi:MAG: glycosyltransferase family 2 protein [Solirubrobacterales bacterium]
MASPTDIERREDTREDGRPTLLSVTVVILAFNRERAVEVTLERIKDLPVDEVLVVQGGDSPDETQALVDRFGPRARLIFPGWNTGVGGRNLAAQEATGDLLLMLDDDSYPLPGAVERLVDAFEADPQLGCAAGLIRDVDYEGTQLKETELGTFDWFLRAGNTGPVPTEGLPIFFFPEGGCLLRRDAFLEVGGWFDPYFFTVSEVDLATRLIGAGWEVRYFPQAVFEHLKESTSRMTSTRVLHHRVRNQIWYFWRHFPTRMAAWRIPVYLGFDFLECVYRGGPRTGATAWWKGIADSWRLRGRVRGTRKPLTVAAVRRAEMNRLHLHLVLYSRQVARRLVPFLRELLRGRYRR